MLGESMRLRRGTSSGALVAKNIGISRAAYYGAEAGTREMNMQTAEALADWLGWTIDAVVKAARKPPTE